MEVNAAAAMAKFKSFRAPMAVKEPQKETPQPDSPAEKKEAPLTDLLATDAAAEAAVAEESAGLSLARLRDLSLKHPSKAPFDRFRAAKL